MKKNLLRLRDEIEKLATEKDLFYILCLVLISTNYTTVIILVDQMEKLVGVNLLTQAFTNMVDSGIKSGINLFFLFLGTNHCKQLNDEDVYHGFVRRFFQPDTFTLEEAGLEKPDISTGPGNDIDRVAEVIKSIRLKVPGAPINEIGVDKRVLVRERLGRVEDPTWQTFWKEMLRAADHSA